MSSLMVASSFSSDMNDEFEDLYQSYAKEQIFPKGEDSTYGKTQLKDITQCSNQYGSLGDVFKSSE